MNPIIDRDIEELVFALTRLITDRLPEGYAAPRVKIGFDNSRMTYKIAVTICIEGEDYEYSWEHEGTLVRIEDVLFSLIFRVFKSAFTRKRAQYEQLNWRESKLTEEVVKDAINACRRGY